MSGQELAPERDAAPPPARGAARHSLVHRLMQLARVVIVVAVVAAVAFAVIKEWHSVRHTIGALSWKSLAASTAAVVLGMFATVKVWQHMLASMGTHVRYRNAAQVNLVGQLGKYLPGSVWAFALQAQLGRRYEIPRARALITLLLCAGISSVTALSLSALSAEPLSDKWGGAAWLLLAGPLCLVFLLPPVLSRIANLALRILRRPLLTRSLHGNEILRAACWSILSWLLFGLHLWLLTGSLARQPLWAYALSVGAFALAMSAGFLAFVLPSGVGVREVVIVAGLAPLAAGGPALAIALISRLLFTFADITTALAAALLARTSPHRDALADNRQY